MKINAESSPDGIVLALAKLDKNAEECKCEPNMSIDVQNEK